MYIEKKYKFEAAYVNSKGIQGSSFEAYVRFNKLITDAEEKKVDQFIDQFDHSIMFHSKHSHGNFLSESERTIVIENNGFSEATPFDYMLALYTGIEEEMQKKILSIKLSDTKDTNYFYSKDDLYIQTQTMSLNNYIIK